MAIGVGVKFWRADGAAATLDAFARKDPRSLSAQPLAQAGGRRHPRGPDAVEGLAAELGAARKVVRRLLKEFERTGIVSVARGRLRMRAVPCSISSMASSTPSRPESVAVFLEIVEASTYHTQSGWMALFSPSCLSAPSRGDARPQGL